MPSRIILPVKGGSFAGREFIDYYRRKTMEKTIEGTVERFIFRNPENGYAVVSLMTPDKVRRTVTGTLSSMREGTMVVCTGEEVTTKYGLQMKISSWDEKRPEDVEGIERYLASGLIKNIGPVLAHEIVKVFGEKTLDILDNNPSRLSKVPGIGKKRIASIAEAVKEQKAIRGVMIWLKRYGLPNGLSVKIYKRYGDSSVRLLEENPYRLADEIKGVGFKKADSVAASLGITPDSPFRIRSGLLHAVCDFTEQGSTYMPADMMLSVASGDDYLSLPEDLVRREFEKWKAEVSNRHPLVDDNGMIYPAWLHAAETKVAERLRQLATRQETLFDDGDGEVDMDALQAATGVTYNSLQAEAIRKALSGNILVLTGGPGTGKTVTTNGIITALEGDGKTVLLCAPTGRAAKRMNEVTGRESSTIHRLLQYGQGGQEGFDPGLKLGGDALVVDESSMIDISLMAALLNAVPDGMKVILVGDVDQLPSVGSGSVLRDIIDSGTVPTVRLTEIYRQAQGSEIIMGAHSINAGRMPRLDNHDGTDLYFIEKEEAVDVADTIIDLVTNRIPRRMNISPDSIQVLSPMRRDGDPIGVSVLNPRLQKVLNPGGEGINHNGRIFKPGDKVMQTKNDYDKNVFNGDTGVVTAVDRTEGEVTVDFQGNSVVCKGADLTNLDLAYASTVHKSQGSEYPVVVIPVHKSHFILLKRNLLYTAVTRAKKICVLVGTKKAVAMAVSREDTASRYSALAGRLDGTER